MGNTQITIGEHRVRTQFNPDKSGTVEEIKQKTAELINLVSSLPDGQQMLYPGESERLKALASTTFEEAAMWAVKAATCEVAPMSKGPN